MNGAIGTATEKATHSRKLLHEVGVLLAHVLGIAAEDGDGAILELVDLTSSS